MDLRLDVIGTKPLLMHNARLADPLDPIAREIKKITRKGAKKTDDDHAEISRLGFLGGLYCDEHIGPYLPGDNFFRMLIDAGKKVRLGTAVKEGVIVMSDVNPLKYSGPRDPEKLWANGGFAYRRAAKVPKNTGPLVQRTRPRFPKDWETSAAIYLDTDVLDLDNLKQLIEIGGSLVGLGDWRPKFGLFTGTLTVTKAMS